MTSTLPPRSAGPLRSRGARAAHSERIAGDDIAVESLRAPTRRRPSWLAAGALLIAVAALLGVWLFSSATSTITVVVAAHDLPPGHVVTRADLRAVEMGKTGGLRAIQVDQQDLVLGAAARAMVPEGTVINTGLFTAPTAVVPAGKVVIGGAFAAGAVPVANLRPGDRVVLLAATPAGAAATGLDAAGVATELGTGEVWAVDGAASASAISEKMWISLLVDDALQGPVAQAAASERLRLGLVPP